MIVLFYHDTVWMGADRDKMNKAVFDALKQGGQYVVVDHSAADGHGKADVKTLHRIDELSVITGRGARRLPCTRAMPTSSVTLATHATGTTRRARRERRGTSDRFVAKFVKP